MDHLEKAVNRLKNGKQEAFDVIYEKTNRYVYFTCLGFVKNEQDAADLSQEVYLTVIKQIQSLEDSAKFIPWLNRITVNKCKNFLAKNTPVLMESDEMQEDIPETKENFLPEEYVVNKAKRELVLEIMRDTLSDVLYQTVLLYYFNEMSVPEIAEVMECPTGTVTYRLSAARAKIKEGVLSHEKKHGEKLYSFVAVPFLTQLFTAEASEIAVPELLGEILSACSVNTAAAVAAEKGAKAMLKTVFKTVKAKVIASVVSVAVVGGGVTTAVVVTKNHQESAIVREETEHKAPEPEKKPEAEGKPEAEVKPESEGKPEEESKQEAEREIITDPEVLATMIEEGTIAYLEALRTGDFDTMLLYTDPSTEYYHKLAALRGNEEAAEMFRMVYKDVCYNDTRGLVRTLLLNALERESEEMFVSMDVGLPDMVYFAYLLPVCLHNPGDRIDVYRPATGAEALELIGRVLEEIPLEDGTIIVTRPNRYGEFYIKPNDVNIGFFDSEMSVEECSEDFVQEYVKAMYEVVGNTVYRSDTGKYYFNHEEYTRFTKLIEQKDMEGIFVLYTEVTGKDLREDEYVLQVYGDCRKLTPEQQRFVEEYMAQVEVLHCDITGVDDNIRKSHLIMKGPSLEMDAGSYAWKTEHNVSEDVFFGLWNREYNYKDATQLYFYAVRYALQYK